MELRVSVCKCVRMYRASVLVCVGLCRASVLVCVGLCRGSACWCGNCVGVLVLVLVVYPTPDYTTLTLHITPH